MKLMQGIEAEKRRSRIVKRVLGIVLLGCAFLLLGPLQALSVIMNMPLVEINHSAIAAYFSPVNSVAAGIVLMLIAINTIRQRMRF